MYRYLCALVKGPSSPDGDSKKLNVAREEPLPVPSLKVKRVDLYFGRWSGELKYRNTSSNITAETIPRMQSSTNDQWKDFSFVIVRTIPWEKKDGPTFKIVVKSEYILKACQDVVQSWPGISWNSDPLELIPEIFISLHPFFLEYAAEMEGKKDRSEEETHLLSSVNLLNSTIASDYRATIATIHRLITHNEIIFDHLYAILIPRSIMVTRCVITGRPRLFHLVSWQRSGDRYQLELESIDLVDRPITHSVVAGKIKTSISLHRMYGTVKIETLDAYPLKFHPNPKGLKDAIVKRGKKWVSLIGIHHKQFDGIAALQSANQLLRHNVRGRIMVDRATFRRLNPNFRLPTPVPSKGGGASAADKTPADTHGNKTPVSASGDLISQVDNLVQTHNDTSGVELTEDDLLLTPAVVFGFSLVDKVWLEFDVEKIEDVEWDEEAFANLVLPTNQKDLLQSLVEAHHKEVGFDDFVKGKGHGLVVNLFGPPGVGKTLSAEATSEHVHRPLYVVGGGDLGTTASALDSALEHIFDVATTWKAIVLIDEADVFLEQRSLHELTRNAMVATFLRHIEYYRGILFLTTNRVKAFDEAFLSRIHVALHFQNLSQDSKEKVWASFLAKAGDTSCITPAQVTELAKRDVNGRQIKNASRTAHSLAVGRGEKLKFEHLMQTLDAMEEFTREFERRLE